MVAFAGVLLLGILKGVLLAALVSMVLLIRRAAVPPVVAPGPPAGHAIASRTAARNPDAQDVPGVARSSASRRASSTSTRATCATRCSGSSREAGEGLRVVVWDLSTSPYVDIAGARMLLDVARELAARGIELRIAEAHATVRDLVRKEDDPALPLPAGRVTVAEAVGV